MTPMQQELLNDQRKQIKWLKEELDVYKQDLKHAFDTIDELSELNDKIEDASDYWKEEFEQFYNAIHRIASLPSEEFTDGDCLDRVMDKLKQYGGQTDEQHEVTW